MELKEYLQIIKKYKKAFFTIWGGILLLAFFTVFVQPVVYKGEATVMIIRDGKISETKVSEEYDYHYQLEADEKLAKILVQFLKDKSLLNRGLNEESDFDKKSQSTKMAISKEEREWVISRVKGEILSSGYVKIKIYSHEEKLVKQISDRVVKQLENKLSKLGTDKNRLLGLEVEPVVVMKKNKPYLPVGAGSFFGGLLIAIFSVLGIHYWKEDEA